MKFDVCKESVYDIGVVGTVICAGCGNNLERRIGSRSCQKSKSEVLWSSKRIVQSDGLESRSMKM